MIEMPIRLNVVSDPAELKIEGNANSAIAVAIHEP